LVTVNQIETSEQIEAARELLREYIDWVMPIESCSHHHPTFQGIEEEIASFRDKYAPPRGCFLMATVDGKGAGCVALRPHEGTKCELKRLYVRPDFRGQGIGGALVEAAIEEARNAAYTGIVLDSHISMKGAHQLYLSNGFRMTDAPADFPEEYKPVVVFMECDLRLAG
jgi:putative acetyltransferase